MDNTAKSRRNLLRLGAGAAGAVAVGSMQLDAKSLAMRGLVDREFLGNAKTVSFKLPETYAVQARGIDEPEPHYDEKQAAVQAINKQMNAMEHPNNGDSFGNAVRQTHLLPLRSVSDAYRQVAYGVRMRAYHREHERLDAAISRIWQSKVPPVLKTILDMVDAELDE